MAAIVGGSLWHRRKRPHAEKLLRPKLAEPGFNARLRSLAGGKLSVDFAIDPVSLYLQYWHSYPANRVNFLKSFQLRQVGNPVGQRRNLLQEAEPVLAHGGVFDHDHDFYEKLINCRHHGQESVHKAVN